VFMFLRKNRKRFDGEVYEYWTLCESVRTERGPRQRVVACLGKFTEEDLSAGWEDIEALLDGRRPTPKQKDLFDANAFREEEAGWELAEGWYARTALEDLSGIPVSAVNDDRLYRALDKVGAHKDRLCEHLLDRYRQWFGVRFEFLLYDVTSTRMEKAGNATCSVAAKPAVPRKEPCSSGK